MGFGRWGMKDQSYGNQTIRRMELRTTGKQDSDASTTQDWYSDVGSFYTLGTTLLRFYDGNTATDWNPYLLRPTRPNTVSGSIAANAANTAQIYYLFRITLFDKYKINSITLNYGAGRGTLRCSLGWGVNAGINDIATGNFYKTGSTDINAVAVTSGTAISVSTSDVNNVARDTIYMVLTVDKANGTNYYQPYGNHIVLGVQQ
jgi:hypothetical protein